MEIVCSADTPYLPHVSAMLHSLLTHTHKRPLRIWLLHGDDLPEDGRARVAAVASSFGAQLEFLRVPFELLHGFPTRQFHYSCWYRVLLPDLLPKLNRALYLDCDVIVTDDLESLWATDLSGKLFGASTNPVLPPMYTAVRETLGLKDFRDYLNSGVLLLDLDKMRIDGSIEKLRTYATAHPDNNCPEQDALSDLMRGRWLSLHPRWNAQAVMYELPAEELPFPKVVVDEALARPAVIHFNGPFKPWQYLCKHPMRGLYFDHLQGTTWPKQPLENSSLSYRLIRPFSLSVQYRFLWWRFRLWPKFWRSLRNRVKGVLRTLTANP
jgi:lipopolysaccharide biosynthesis glycosyltransferase